MSSGIATRCLLKNAWYLSSNDFHYGYVFLHGSRVEDVGEGDPLPEYELAELVYDFEGDALIVHGYSLIVDIVEYVVRGMSNIDLSVFTDEELRKLANVGLVNAYMNGVTVPVAKTRYSKIVGDVARENAMRVGLLAERGTVSRNPFTVLLEVDDGWLYFEDKRLGEYSSMVCKPYEVRETCILVDARGYGNITTAIENVYSYTRSPEVAFRLLTNFYRVANIDNGFVERRSASDIIVYDLKNPLKSMPITSKRDLYSLLARSQQPDMVFIGGEIFYEHGENLAIPVVKINELLKRRIATLKHE
ncbi:MAG: hypothetical protein QXY11_01330 [Desulfurococcaceae archaeon]